MPREKRVWIPHRFYHIVMRGNRRDPLFRSATDFHAFLHILHQLHHKIPFELASYRVTGHVFEKRFYDTIIEDKSGMIEVSRYIHLNPVKAKMVKRPEHYPWSSYDLYKNRNAMQPRFMKMEAILDYYVATLEERRKLYCEGVGGDMDI